MVVEKDETVAVRSSDDVVRVRQAVRARAIEAGFGIVDQTKLVTAASEIARNTVDYGGGGTLVIEIVREGARRGVQLTFSDNGPDESGLGHWRSSPHIPGSRTKLPPGSCPQEREGRQNGLGRRPVVKAASGR